MESSVTKVAREGVVNFHLSLIPPSNFNAYGYIVAVL